MTFSVTRGVLAKVCDKSDTVVKTHLSAHSLHQMLLFSFPDLCLCVVVALSNFILSYEC